MRPRIEDSIGDDAMEDCGFLKFTDTPMKGSFLQTLSTMRKHRLFCDVIINVDNSDIHAHKNVLACVSPHLMELFSAEESTQYRHSDGVPSYRLNGGLTKMALEILVEYAYTAQLEVPDALVKDVYLAACQLRIDSVVNECARHLVDGLCADSCIETRSLPGITKNRSFVTAVDGFISREFDAVSKTAEFLQLTCANIDVLYQTKQEMSLVTHESLSRLVLDWMKRQLTEETMNMNQLLERTHLLYLALDNSLQDCSDLPPGHESESDLVQDYKRLVLKCPNNKGRRKQLGAPVRPRVLIYSREIGQREDRSGSIEPDWNLIGSAKVGENTFLALITLNGSMARVSVQLRLNLPPTTPSPVHAPEKVAGIVGMGSQLSRSNTSSSGSINAKCDDDLNQQPELFCEVATMSGPKCGLGVAEWDGKLLVCGGYDRGECLRSVESYDPELNAWTNQSNMGEARGRVQISVVNNIVYAVGGSNGTTELDTVERLEQDGKKWHKCCKLPLARSNAGVCTLYNRIYCVGGWNGQIGIKQCDVYRPLEDKWTSISSLNTGRYQAGVAAFKNKLWAAGGSDAWSCLSSVETYDPDTDRWTYAPSLLTLRRGCGLAEFNGKLYAVGGSDGTHSLSSTEIFDEESQSWIVGPNLTTPRANVSVVSVAGRLYAIGGFAGKFFLNTIEYLDPVTNEWTTFIKQNANNQCDMISADELTNDISQLQAQLNEVFVNEATAALAAAASVSSASTSNNSMSNEHATENGSNGCNDGNISSIHSNISRSSTDDTSANGYHADEAKEYSKIDHSVTSSKQHSDQNQSNGNGNENGNRNGGGNQIKIKDKNGSTDKLSKLRNMNAATTKNGVNGTSS